MTLLKRRKLKKKKINFLIKKRGVNIYFRQIDLIRTEGDYTLVRDTTGKQGYLSLYDSVIVEGTDLYDGKIILQ